MVKSCNAPKIENKESKRKKQIEIIERKMEHLEYKLGIVTNHWRFDAVAGDVARAQHIHLLQLGAVVGQGTEVSVWEWPTEQRKMKV